MEKLNEIKNLVEENSKLEKKMKKLGIINIAEDRVHFKDDSFLKLFDEYEIETRDHLEYQISLYKKIEDFTVFCLISFSQLKKLDKQKAIELLECF